MIRDSVELNVFECGTENRRKRVDAGDQLPGGLMEDKAPKTPQDLMRKRLVVLHILGARSMAGGRGKARLGCWWRVRLADSCT